MEDVDHIDNSPNGKGGPPIFDVWMHLSIESFFELSVGLTVRIQRTEPRRGEGPLERAVRRVSQFKLEAKRWVRFIVFGATAHAAAPFSFPPIVRMYSSTVSPGVLEGPSPSPEIVNPHFFKTRREARLCFATRA